MQDLYRELTELAGKGNVICKEPLSRHVTFRTGGDAAYFVTADSRNLPQLICFFKENNVKHYMIGNGSNLLFPDEGYEGVVVKLKSSKDDIRINGETMTVGGGVLLSKAAKTAGDAGLAGMEFAAGIPGTVGGAVVMNAGAYGGEMKDILLNVTALDGWGREQILKKEELKLSYRHSVIPERGLVVVGAELKLHRGDKEQIAAQMEELAARRREKQPLEYPSAGSTFKRPEGYFAGKLIEDAGLKGFSVGGAQVSEKHSGFVINRDHATTADILELIEKVQQIIMDKFGVKLEMEVKVVR